MKWQREIDIARKDMRNTATVTIAITDSVSKITIGDIASQIDHFFHDPANLNIPVSQALHFYLMEFKGEKRATLDGWLSQLRKFYNK
jgi:hypothetical protein